MRTTIGAGDARVERVVDFYQQLTPPSLALIDQVYAIDAHFKDPFNDVGGLEAIRRVFQHMFDSLVDPRFEVLEAVVRGDVCFLTWNFHFRRRPGSTQAWRIHGATRLAFDRDGRVADHRDYWDPAEEVYSRLPILGGLMRWLQRQGRA